MKIFESGGMRKPKNFSRKNFICSCQCPVILNGSKGAVIPIADFIMVKYEIIPNKDFHYEKPRKHYWRSYEHWGDFKKVIELPPIFSKLNEDDFIIYTGYFARDNVQMPYISSVVIINHEKYKMLKIKEQRKNKLKRIKN